MSSGEATSNKLTLYLPCKKKERIEGLWEAFQCSVQQDFWDTKGLSWLIIGYDIL